jgi:hypothetical protein
MRRDAARLLSVARSLTLLQRLNGFVAGGGRVDHDDGQKAQDSGDEDRRDHDQSIAPVGQPCEPAEDHGFTAPSTIAPMIAARIGTRSDTTAMR